MSRARQVANFDPALFAADEISGDKVSGGTIGAGTLGGTSIVDTSGAITTTGAFTSVGIDDDANALAMTIDATENVGIGTATPDLGGASYAAAQTVTTISGSTNDQPGGILELNSAAANAYNSIQGEIVFTGSNQTAGHKRKSVIRGIIDTSSGDTSNQYGGGIVFLNKPDASTTMTERMRIDSSGNVGIGVTSPDDCKLHIQEGDSGGTCHSLAQLCIESSIYAGLSMLAATNVSCYIFFGDSGAANDGAITYNNNSRVMSFITADTSAMTISSSQVVSGDLNDTSDIALKENIITLSSGELSKINLLRPVSFDWKKEGKGSTVGFIAQEVEEIFPTEVNGEDYDDTSDDGVNIKSIGKSINTIGIVAHLTKAVQELSAKNDALETENTALKTRMDALEAKVTALENA